ncbi:MAG: DUF4367 domain-containing protein [Clostridia bacterium]|nr:DUF4367 domain-containing protein [Clostridia bacterium]
MNDKKIKEAFALYRKNWEEDLPDDRQLEEIKISHELDRKVRKLIRGKERKIGGNWRIMLQTAACIAGVIILSAAAFIVLEKNGGDPTNIYDNPINSHGEIPERPKQDSENPLEEGKDPDSNAFEGEVLLPEAVPVGFVMTGVDGDKAYIRHEYQTASGGFYLHISQIFKDVARPLDLQEDYCRKVSIKEGVEGVYYNDGENAKLIFEYKKYRIHLEGDLFLEDFIEIAQSMIK